MRVLLVEDTDDLRHLFARVLRGHRCVVLEAADAKTALDVVEAFAPELILTDLMMPEMDGVELIRRLRMIPGFVAVPIVAITADSTTEAWRRALQAGAVDVVLKPIDVGLILDRLSHYRVAPVDPRPE